ncbi:MAG: hypothetical protein JST28_22635 [Acidobacteria bacterium]|nr:hypothetical protein [Acidobacteriota bacterium]
MSTSEKREGLVHLDVSAKNQLGETVEALKAEDLKLLQDESATKILSFERSKPGDLSEVTLVLDEVDLSPEQFISVRMEVLGFLRRDRGVLAQPVSILWIKPDGVYRSPFPSTDGFFLADDIESDNVVSTGWVFRPTQKAGTTLRTGGDLPPGAVLRSSITIRDIVWSEVLHVIYAQAAMWRDKPGRKALIWFGYGWSVRGVLDANGGVFPVLVELATRMRESRMVLYEVSPWPDPEFSDSRPKIDYHQFLSGVRSPLDPAFKWPIPYLSLPVLAIRSGGLVLDKSKDLGDEAARCIADAAEFYTVSFDPPHAAQSDEYRDLEAKSGSPEVSLRTTRGYYNQPVLYDQPRTPEKKLKVAELQELIQTNRTASRNLESLQLSERLSTAQLGKLTKSLHGRKAQTALIGLADESVFLGPSKEESPALASPDDQMKEQIIARAEKYLDEVAPTLPDFSADAVTVKFEQQSVGKKDTWKTAPADRDLRQTVSEQSNLLYRNGREQRSLEKVNGKRIAGRNELNYFGIFGPLLKFILDDVRRGNSKLTWIRWEQLNQEVVAVFRYSVRSENPRYGVTSCCLVDGARFETFPEHHGELAIVPASGAVLRITVESDPGWIREADLSPVRPVLFSDLMVEYGPVDIGGRIFICPKRSVAITRTRTVVPISFWGMDFKVYGPYQTLMNDTTYLHYHKFGSEFRILPDFTVVPDKKIH